MVKTPQKRQAIGKKNDAPKGAILLTEELADKPGSVVDNHSSGMHVAAHLKQPTRTQREPRHKGSYLVLLRTGFTIAMNCCQSCGALLPHLFNLTVSHRGGHLGGTLSAALSVGLRPPGVTWRSALWSPDFPLLPKQKRLPSQLRRA